MMILNAPYDEAGPRNEESLLAVLAGAARRKTDGALAVWAGAGVLGAVLIGVALPGWWALLLLAVAASAFGGWGIVDRELAERLRAAAADPLVRTREARETRWLRASRAALAVLGLAAGGVALLLAFAGALGTWIS
jgi:hypothetical protein